MNKLLPLSYDSERPTTSARSLWEFLDKPWGEFMKWFSKFSDYGFTENVDYRVIEQSFENPQGGRPATDYEITIDMAKELSMLQRTEKGKMARRHYIELEKAWNSPEMVMARSLQFAAKRLDGYKEKLQHAEQTLEQQKPKVLFADAVEVSKTSILIGDLAKIIKQNGYDIGQKRLFEYLRQNEYLIKGGSSKNMPTQRSMDAGWFEIKESTINNPDGSVRVTKTTKVTGKGQVYFINKFLAKLKRKGA